MHQRRETNEAKIKVSSIKNNHLSNGRRQKQSLRRTWSHGLPTLATDTVKMVVATLQLGEPTTDFIEEKTDEDIVSDDDDDDMDHEVFSMEEQVQAHIPDIVLTKIHDLIDRKGTIAIPNAHTYANSTLLFLDVSGFTKLTEQYSNDAHLGVGQLTRTLSRYFNKLVYEILKHHGDIYKFAGDAILALWTNESKGPQQALHCALHLQQKCGAYETNVGVTLRVKVALAYGSVQALFVGTEAFKHYLLTGDCVKNVNICEQLCEPGDIIITKAFHEKLHTDSFNCEFQPVSESIDPQQNHIVVKYTLSRRSSLGADSDPEEHLSSATIINARMDNLNPEEIHDDNQQSTKNDLTDDELGLRINSLLKSFLLRCVHQRIDRQQSLDYLLEFRRVTISFVNLDISNDQTIGQNIHDIIHKIFVQIYELTDTMGGVLTKGLLFDKGWSFLCVFGLPGYKQGDDTANALKCAQMIHSTLREQCPFVDKCSIGVTTGLTYCGVLGHRARCEYTVIGRKVNMAARLMCNYPNIVSCDQETYYNSRLHHRLFQKLPNKALKGMSDVGSIWHYGDDHDSSQVTEQQKASNLHIDDIRHENFPLLGRRVELMTVAAQIMLLDAPDNSSDSRKDLAAIIFEGEDKIGRSRLLQFIANSLDKSTNVNNVSALSYYNNSYIPDELTSSNSPICENEMEPRSSLSTYANDYFTTRKPSIRVINYRCQFEQRFNELGLLRALLRQLLQYHNNEKNQREREQTLLRLFDINTASDLHLRRNLYLLNDLLDVRFPRRHVETDNTSDSDLNELLLYVLNKLIDPHGCIGDIYDPIPLATLANISCPNYTQARVSCSSMTSLGASIIPTVSKIIFIIDDIHFADETSLKHLLTLGSHSRSLLILSMKPPRKNSSIDRSNSSLLQSISTDSRVYLRRLPGLELRYLATLGCQMLSVHRVPAKLVKVFNESCNGIPGFCEQILFDLLSKDKIYLVDSNTSHNQSGNLVEGDPDKLLIKTSLRAGLVKTFFSRRKQQITTEQRQIEPVFSRICLLRDPAENDFNPDCQQNFQNYIMCRIDRLSEGESLLVKIATVIGSTFSRMFLWHLVDPQSKKLINIHSCILEMMQRTLIECAFSAEQPHKTRSIKCYCLQNPTGFAAQCRLMAFSHSTIREGIYNSLTDGLKRLLTRAAIDYLEKQCTPVCLTCGTSKNDIPFLVNEQDGLTKIVRSSQQHAFADIVKMAALKEIDNTIKQLSRSGNSSVKTRSNTSMKLIQNSMSLPNGKELSEIDGSTTTNDNNNNTEKRRSSFNVGDTDSSDLIRRQSSFPLSNDEEPFEEELVNSQTLQRRSSDPNLTLISVYSPDNMPTIQVNVQPSSAAVTSTRTSQLFSLFKIPKRQSGGHSSPLHPEKSIPDESSPKKESVVSPPTERKQKRSNRLISMIRYIFCRFVQIDSHAAVSPALSNQTTNKPINNRKQSDDPPKDNENPNKYSSHWRKLRKAVLPTRGNVIRALPNEDELRQQSLFSQELMADVIDDILCLNKQTSFTRTFESLYKQSLQFHIFESYVQHNHLIQYVSETKQTENEPIDYNQFIQDFHSYTDLRICECADYVMIVYVKLAEYHTNLYDMYEKNSDEKHETIRLKQFDRIIYYRLQICRLLLQCSCLQRLLVEIENGRKFLKKFQSNTNYEEDLVYQYHAFVVQYTLDYLQASVLQRTRVIHDAKQICEEGLKELNKAYEEKTWEKLKSYTESTDSPLMKEKRQHHDPNKINQSKESLVELNSTGQSSSADQHLRFHAKYRLKYLLCQYHLLHYSLTRFESSESINTLIELDYHQFPITFSVPCTIVLVEYFHCQMNYERALALIDTITRFWWSYIGPREKMEFAKLKALSLIIELKQGSFESAIASAYVAKRILTGYHENIFLIESCIHLTLALIGEMRMANIELILQHLEYLSEQTMNCYAKLWYYILILDVAIELGYEFLPITSELLENITKYRKKLLPGPYQRSLILLYSDCTLAQIYARLGLLDMSKIHFHQALHQIKYDHMHLSNSDFRLKRAVLKLVEIQLIHWYHTRDYEDVLTQDYFLLGHCQKFPIEEFHSWNKTRLLIYQAYYDRLINDYRKQKNLPIDNDYNWEGIFHEAEKDAIKLDSEWIKALRNAWLHPVTEQISLQGKSIILPEQARRSTIVTKQGHRRVLRASVPFIRMSMPNENNTEKLVEEQTSTIEDYSSQKFMDWRSVSRHSDTPQFQLYILPVRV